MRFASRMSKLPPSPTLAMNTKAAEMKAEGADVISFAAGEPDFDTPEHVKEGAVQGLRDGATKYTAVRGMPSLREAICEWVEEHKGLRYDPKTEAIVTVGGKQSVFNALHVLVEEGDEVVIPAPIWVAYEPVAALTGAKPVLVRTSEENGHKMTADELREAVSPRTKIVVINSPCNPTGCVYGREELEAIAEVVLSTNAMVMADEIYGKITYDGEAHVSIAALSLEMKARALVLDGVLAGRTRLLESVTAAHKSRLVLIRMLAPADEMIGADMGRYGPYSAEDIATVPLENAVALVAQGMAARVGAD